MTHPNPPTSPPQSTPVTLALMCFHLLALCTPFIFTWVNEELFEFNKMLFVYGLTIIIGGCWAWEMIRQQRWVLTRTPLDIPLALFVVSQILSTVFSIHPYTSVFGYYTRFHGGLLSTIAYVTLYYAFVSLFRRQQVRNFFVSLFLGGLGSALYAIPEHFGHSPSCWLITKGERFDVSCWVQDVQTRVFGTFGQPNWLAAYATTLIPLGIGLSMSEALHSTMRKSAHWRNPRLWLFGLTTGALTATLAYTQSRSGVLGLAGGLTLFVASVGFMWSRLSTSALLRPSLQLGGGLLLVLLVITAVTGTPFSPPLQRMMTPSAPLSAPEQELPETAPVNRLEVGGSSSGEIRKIVWTGALRVWQRYPLFGSGVETFGYSYYQDRPLEHNHVSEWDFLYNKAHNEFLNFLATTGIVGLGSYLALLGTYGALSSLQIIQSGQKLRQKHLPSEESSHILNQAFVLSGLLAGVVGLSISNFFGFSTVMVSVLMFLFLACFSVLRHHAKESPQTEKTPEWWSAPRPADHQLAVLPLAETQYLALGATWIVCFVLLMGVARLWFADAAFTQGKALLQSGQATKGLAELERAVALTPQEPLFHDELANTYAIYAVEYARLNRSAEAAEYQTLAMRASDRALELNTQQRNFYKSRARVFILLSQIDPAHIAEARIALETAMEKAPTDPKVRYNLSRLELQLGNTDRAFTLLSEAVEMKPNYEGARYYLAEMYESRGELERAREQYQYILDHLNPNNELAQAKRASLSAQPAPTPQP